MNRLPASSNDRRNKGKGLVRLSSTFQAAKSFFHVLPNEPVPDTTVSRQLLSSVENVLRSSLEKLLSTLSVRKHRALCEQIQQKLEFFISLHTNEQQPHPQEASSVTQAHHITQSLWQQNSDIFEIFQAACKTRSIKTVLASLDGMQRLLSCGFFSTPQSTAHERFCETGTPFTDKLQASPRVTRCPTEHSTSDTCFTVKVLETIASCAELPDDAVQLQVVRCILTAITASSADRIHGKALVRNVSHIFALYGRSKCIQNQRTAEAALTQIVNFLMSCIGNGLQEDTVDHLNTQQSEGVADFSTSSQTMSGNPSLSEKGDRGYRSRSVSYIRVTEPNECLNFGASLSGVGSEKFHLSDPVYCGESGVITKEMDSFPQRPHAISVSPKSSSRSHSRKCDSFLRTGISSEERRHSDTLEYCTLNTFQETTTAQKKERQLLIEDALQVFSLLCSFTVESSDAREGSGKSDSPSLRIKKLSLDILLSVFQNSSHFLRVIPPFVDRIRHELFLTLVTDCVSHIPKIFGPSMSLFSLVFIHFKDVLAPELALFVDFIFLHLLESWNSSYEYKQHVLQVLHFICADTKFVVELYINFDCKVNETHVFLCLVNSLCRIAKLDSSGDSASFGGGQDQHVTLQKQALEVLVILLKNICAWVDECDHTNENAHYRTNQTLENKDSLGSTLGDEPLGSEIKEGRDPKKSVDGASYCSEKNKRESHTWLLEHQRHRKQLLLDYIKVFNTNPAKGLDLIIKDNYVENTPENIATFFLRTPTLKKEAIGNYLGSDKAMNVLVLRALVSQLDFRKLEIDTAIKKFLSVFRLPGEAQKIDRMMECFASKYVQDNPGKFATADCAYVLSFSLIMLHTDAHTTSIKPQNKMTVDMFIRNNRGINDNADLSSEYLESLYYRVVAQEWTLEENTFNYSEPEGADHRSSLHWSGASPASTFDTQQPFFDGIVSTLGFSSSGKKKFEQFLKESKCIVAKTTSELQRRMQQKIQSPNISQDVLSKNLHKQDDSRDASSHGKSFSTDTALQHQSKANEEYIRATDAFVDQVEFLFLTIHESLLLTIKTVLSSEVSEPLFQAVFDLMEYALVICSHFNLVKEAGSYLSYLVTRINLSFKTDLKTLNETVCSSVQLQCLQHLFTALLVHKCYRVCEECWKDILECCSQLTTLFQMEGQMGEKSIHQARPLVPTTSTNKIHEVLEDKNAQNIPLEHLHTVGMKDPLEDSAGIHQIMKTDVSTSLPLLFSSEALRGVLGLGKPARNESAKEAPDYVEVNHDDPVESRQTKFILNYNIIHSVVNETQIDSLFLSSTHFPCSCIVSFIKCLCDVSKEELQMQPPRMFSLQKLVEITDYNMNRIHLIWFKIWEVLVAYFLQVTSYVSRYESLDTGLYAVDSLRQLTIKFLEKDELSNYSFQEEFLKPFLVSHRLALRRYANNAPLCAIWGIFFQLLMQSASVTDGIKLFLIEILKQIIQIRAQNIRSGWRCILLILDTVPTVESQNTLLCQDALNTLMTLLTNNFETIFARYTKEVIKAFTSYATYTTHITLSLNGSSTTLSHLTLHYLEALTVILAGHDYAAYCSALRCVPNLMVLEMEKKILNTSHKREKLQPTLTSPRPRSQTVDQNAQETYVFQSRNSFDDEEAGVYQYVALLSELHLYRSATVSSTDQHKDANDHHESHEGRSSTSALTQEDDYLHTLLRTLQSHHSTFLFPLLTCLSHLATLNKLENYAVHQQALITLFRLFHTVATQLFNEDMWKMCIRGILFPFFDDLQLYFQSQKDISGSSPPYSPHVSVSLETSKAQHEPSQSSDVSSHSVFSSPLCSSPHQFYNLCLDLLLEIMDHHFAIIRKYFAELLSLIGSCVRGSNVEIVSHLAVQTVGKMLDRIGSRLNDTDWDIVIYTVETLFQSTSTNELLTAIPPHWAYVSSPSSIGASPSSASPTFSCASNAQSKPVSTVNETPLDLEPPFKNSPKESLLTPPPLSTEQIVRNCASRLFLIDLTTTSLFSHLHRFSYVLLDRIIVLLINSFEFARTFNRQISWRYYLKTIGFLKFTRKLPALLKQEREALKAAFLYLFTFLNGSDFKKCFDDIQCASEKLVSLIENVIGDISTITQFQPLTSSMATLLEISEPEFKEMCMTELEHESTVILDVISHSVLENLKKLPDEIFKLHARRIFLCLLSLTNFKLPSLRQTTMSLLIFRVSPLLENALTSSKKNTENKLSSTLPEYTTECDTASFQKHFFYSPPPPSNV